jgi:hypothetical protein
MQPSQYGHRADGALLYCRHWFGNMPKRLDRFLINARKTPPELATYIAKDTAMATFHYSADLVANVVTMFRLPGAVRVCDAHCDVNSSPPAMTAIECR